MRATFEVADVLRNHWPQVEHDARINAWQLRTLGAIMRCRTSDLGYHLDSCTTCGVIRISYNSCRNRHCPKCQAKNREEWIQKREKELLPAAYFHVVFTLPDLLNPLALYKPDVVYRSLFDTAWDTMKTFGNDPKHLGASTGMIAILHTWGQTLTLHPHLHCIVPAGGLTRKGIWKAARSKGKFLFPVKAMNKVFRAKFIESLKNKIPDVGKGLINDLFKKQWVVYAKRPFGNPQSVLEYLGRYTHKIAISNHRIINIQKNTVSFTYKDYRKGGQKQVMTLDSMEFIRRFSLHILPKKFVKIRHYGILSTTNKKVTIPSIILQLPVKTPLLIKQNITGHFNHKTCPHCKTETMVTIQIIPKRGPPKLWPQPLLESKSLNK